MAIREVSPGVWHVVVYKKRQPDGTRPRVTKTVHGGRRAAERLERDLLSARDHNRPIGRTSTLSEYFQSWLDHRRPDVEPQTFVNYEHRGTKYVTDYIGSLRLDQVTPPVVRDLMKKLSDNGLSGSTRKGGLQVLSMVMGQAVRDHLIAINPCDAVRPPRQDRREPQALTHEDLRELLRLLEGTSVHLPAIIAYDTGLRRQEVLGLQWEDVDLKARTLRVSRAAEKVKGHAPRLKDTKTPRSRRLLKLSEPAAAALKAHKAELARIRLQFPDLWEENGLVFPTLTYHGPSEPMGRLWTPGAFSHAWRKALTFANEKRLGEFVLEREPIDDDELAETVAAFEPWEFGAYVLRHTFTTHLDADGVRVEVISRALGHSSSYVTRTVYSHVFDEEEAATAEVTGRVLAGDRS